MRREMLRVVAYDIADDRRRNRIADMLEEWGVRVQYSVFEMRLTNSEAKRLFASLRRVVEPGDSLRLYTIPDSMFDRCDVYGGLSISDSSSFVLA